MTFSPRRVGRLGVWLTVLGLSLGTAVAQEGSVWQLDLGATGDFSAPLQILIILTLLTVLPAVIMSMTCFTRIIVVVHFLRQALGTQQTPNNQILIGLSLFLSIFIMGPVLDQIYDEAIAPYQAGAITQLEALEGTAAPLRTFMLTHVRETDLALFVGLARLEKPDNRDQLPLRVIVPAFMISELKTAFQVGFVLFLPFLIIDIVISSVLLSMGMMQLPPIVISTPFKVLLFILVDGWHLVLGSLVKSF